MKKMIYFDSAASTPIYKEILNEMQNISLTTFGNASSIHKFGQETKAIIERARLSIANDLGCNLSEIIFTGCGSESNNIAILGILKRGDHFITSSYEHPAVLNIANSLVEKGIEASPINEVLIEASLTQGYVFTLVSISVFGVKKKL